MKARWARARKVNDKERGSDIPDRALLISIQPRFSQAILSGTKTIELRRTLPTLPVSALALIYSSSPTKALVGWATIGGIVQATPTALWKDHASETGVSSSEFAEYFAGRSNAVGLQLVSVHRARSLVSLSALRAHGLVPPQSWRYIPLRQAEGLRDEMMQEERAPLREEHLELSGRTST